MIPSVVAHELIAGLEEYIEKSFEPANEPLKNIVHSFLRDQESSLTKGPYLEFSLPFRRVDTKRDYFERVPVDFIPYIHQEQAFYRLGGDSPQSTLITTGTGSGKTECFLYPILDYCARNSDSEGIKAVIVYPMNALATDQAERVAKKIAESDSLRGNVRVGLYTGDSKDDRETMTKSHVIESRYALRKSPPDVLLTNYKMLDLLLMRVEDQALWEVNSPNTLRYMVVDELHTFDGAQGTGLACLMRRVKLARGIPENQLVCIGTSATMGVASSGDIVESHNQLREFAQRIFGEPFPDDAVISEVRQSTEEFFGGHPIERTLSLPREFHNGVDPRNFVTVDAYVKRQCELFFNSELDLERDEWEIELGQKLLQHSTFRHVRAK